MLKIELSKAIGKVTRNLDKIPNEFFVRTDGNKYQVLWLMDRQRPSVEQSYDFDEERFGITNDGKIIWGFDSGCSCPSPWSQEDFGDDNYNIKTWKEFVVYSEGKIESNEKNRYNVDSWFDETWEDESLSNLRDYLLLIKKNLKPLEVLKIENSEVRRYLIKRVGYENIKKDANVQVLHTDGTSDLLQINEEKYVKVKDTSTSREYLLYVPDHIKTCKQGIAWTFDLKEEEYNPLIES